MCIALPMKVLESGPMMVVCERNGRRLEVDCSMIDQPAVQYRTMCIGTPNILTDEQMAEVMERFRSYGQPGSGKAGY